MSGTERERGRVALVLSGGGARGAYEAGVLSYLFERIYPELPEGFEFDIVSGTSVGAIHAAFVAASADLTGPARSKGLTETWTEMSVDHVLRLTPGDLFGVPMRALGLRPRVAAGTRDVVGGLVDIAPLERLVEQQIPWSGLRKNLAAKRPAHLCVACTEIHTGMVTVFVDGEGADTGPWDRDPTIQAIHAEIDARHVRASAAIPFLFPAVRIDEGYYVDGGLRVNTPLSPALRLGADRVLVVGLKVPPAVERVSAEAESAIAQPAFIVGKMLNVLVLDQLEHEIRRMETINTIMDAASSALGAGCIDAIQGAIGRERGLEYRTVESVVVRPSEDIGSIAASAHKGRKVFERGRGFLAEVLMRSALSGVPESEADLFSYLYFDGSFARPLIELGRKDAESQHDEILGLLS